MRPITNRFSANEHPFRSRLPVNVASEKKSIRPLIWPWIWFGVSALCMAGALWLRSLMFCATAAVIVGLAWRSLAQAFREYDGEEKTE